jgi:RES domain-containing protein
VALDVDPIRINGTWYRQVPHRASLSYRPADPPDGRWQRGEVIEGFYLAETDSTAWAEWYRLLAELAVRPTDQMPRNLWRWEVSVVVADLRTERRLERVDLPLPSPGRSGWPAFQAVGGQLYAEGWSGLVAPSAARRRGRAICLFRTDARVPGTRPIPPPMVYRYPPVPPIGMST